MVSAKGVERCALCTPEGNLNSVQLPTTGTIDSWFYDLLSQVPPLLSFEWYSLQTPEHGKEGAVFSLWSSQYPRDITTHSLELSMAFLFARKRYQP